MCSRASRTKFNLSFGAARRCSNEINDPLKFIPRGTVIKPNKLPVQFSNTIITAPLLPRNFLIKLFMSRLITWFCAALMMMKRNLYPSELVAALRGVQKRYIKEEKIYPNHPRALCVHAWQREVCVYIVYAFRGPPTMDQHARCIFDDLSTITILGRRYLQSSTQSPM